MNTADAHLLVSARISDDMRAAIEIMRVRLENDEE